jgi:hypothetical protein
MVRNSSKFVKKFVKKKETKRNRNIQKEPTKLTKSSKQPTPSNAKVKKVNGPYYWGNLGS